MLTQTYQKLLLFLLATILASNLILIWDNWQTRVITNSTLHKVVEILEVPPSEVYKAVEQVQTELKDIRTEQRVFQDEIKAR